MYYPALFFAQETQETSTTPAATQPAVRGDYEEGMGLYRQGRYAAAIEELEKVTVADPNHAAAWYLIGYGHYVLKHHQGALAAFAKAFQADSSLDPRPYFRHR